LPVRDADSAHEFLRLGSFFRLELVLQRKQICVESDRSSTRALSFSPRIPEIGVVDERLLCLGANLHLQLNSFLRCFLSSSLLDQMKQGCFIDFGWRTIRVLGNSEKSPLAFRHRRWYVGLKPLNAQPGVIASELQV
jgi:hypothetical protein